MGKKLIIILYIALFSSAVVAKEADLLNVIPNMKDGQEEDMDGRLSKKSKKILNQIYREQKRRNKENSKKVRYNIDHMSNPTVNLDGYDTISGEGRFDIKIKKPGRKLEKKHSLYNKAYNSMLDAQYEVAIFYYETILKKNYKDEYALVGLALAYHHLGDIVLAKKFYSKAIDYYPNNLVAINNFLILIGKESPKESLDELLKVDKVFSNNHVLKAQISYLYAKQEKFEDSIKYIDEALAVSKNNAIYLYNKAVVLDYQGENIEARKIYKYLLNLKSVETVGISTDQIKSRLDNMGT